MGWEQVYAGFAFEVRKKFWASRYSFTRCQKLYRWKRAVKYDGLCCRQSIYERCNGGDSHGAKRGSTFQWMLAALHMITLRQSHSAQECRAPEVCTMVETLEGETTILLVCTPRYTYALYWGERVEKGSEKTPIGWRSRFADIHMSCEPPSLSVKHAKWSESNLNMRTNAYESWNLPLYKWFIVFFSRRLLLVQKPLRKLKTISRSFYFS